MLQNQNYIQLLKWIWLSENSAKIYLSLLQNWISAISDLTNYTWLHRVQIYRLIPILIEIWFIFEIIKWKRKFYKPANPEKINLEYAKIFDNNKPVM
jgi:sugar-specific transcriptional regulator TrmB